MCPPELLRVVGRIVLEKLHRSNEDYRRDALLPEQRRQDRREVINDIQSKRDWKL